MRSPAICLFIVAVASAVGQSPASSLEGRAITRIDFDPAAQPLTRSEQEGIIVPLRVGTALRMADVRSAIQALYLTGRYRDLAVDAEPDGTGVSLRILTDFNYFVSGVTVQGEVEPPNASQLATAAKLRTGSAVTDADVEQAKRNIMDRLRANGFYHAQVTHRIDKIPETEEAHILFQIQAGKRAAFDGVKVAGQFSRPVAGIVAKTGWKRGFLFVPLPGWREVTENRIQTGLERVRQDSQGQNHLQSSVTLKDLDYHEATNRVTPSIEIQEGPLTEVRTTGVSVSKSQLRQLIPVYQERTVDRNLLVEGRRNLLEYFQSKGYFDVDIDFTQSEPKPGEALIEYTVKLGARHKLVNITIGGNKYFDTETLIERMYILPATLLRNRNGRFSQRLLDQDKTTIRDLYRANGFRDVEVTSSVAEDFRGTHGNLSVSIQLKEGKQWSVSRLDIVGVSAEDEQYLRGILQSTEGQPYSEATVAADRDQVLGYFFNNGYPGAMFDWTQTDVEDPASERNQVALRFEIKLGDRQYVRKILISGLSITNRKLVEKRILLDSGDAISQSLIGQSQQKLYDLGIFSKVQPAVQNPDGNEVNKYVIFHLDEARKYSVNFGFGAELARIGGGATSLSTPAGSAGFSPRASVGVSRINFLGLGHTISLQTLASTIRQRALFNYVAPQFAGRDNLSLTFSTLVDNAHDVRTFSALRLEGSVQLSQRLSRANSIQYRYTFRDVELTQLNIDPVLIQPLSQPDLTGLLGASFIQDRRDDPVNTRKGVYNTADLAWSEKAFGSQTDFTRLLLRNSTYYRLGKDLVLARSVQFGYIQRFGGLPQIPLAERFYAGGASSQRAFPENQAGPRDLTTGFPLGGSALLVHSTEFRFPLIGDNVGGVLFHDMGNVYSNVTSISFRAVQRDLKDFDYMVHAVGFGIRYRTPVGPIRVDLGLSPNSPRFNGYAGTRDDLLKGLPDPVTQRISVFQFHFSLGQTF